MGVSTLNLSANNAPGRDASASAGERSILIVDDEPLIRMLVADYLNEIGYNVSETGDSAEALDFLRSDASLDLIIADVGLPAALDGMELVRAGRNLRPDLKAIYITAYAHRPAMEMEGESRTRVVDKPFIADVLVENVRELLT